MKSDLERSSEEYEQAEARFMAAVRERLSHPQLAVAAQTVAEAAARFNAEAYRKFHAGEEDAWMPLDQLTERTEVWQSSGPTWRARSAGSPHHLHPRAQRHVR